MTAPAPRPTLFCSFCLKSEHEIAKLVAGPAALYICDECVALCLVWMNGGTPDAPAASRDAMPTERLLERLRPIEESLGGMQSQLHWAVRTLRDRGVSWARIGEALGVTRQSVWERFSSVAK